MAGEGFAAAFLRKLLEMFNPLTGAGRSDDDWRDCFGEPNPPDYVLIRVMFLLYIISVILCILQVIIFKNA